MTLSAPAPDNCASSTEGPCKVSQSSPCGDSAFMSRKARLLGLGAGAQGTLCLIPPILIPSCSLLPSFLHQIAIHGSLFVTDSPSFPDIAIGIQENGCKLNADYDFGDNKQKDDACFGPFKNNWANIRTICEPFKGKGLSADDWAADDGGKMLKYAAYYPPFSGWRTSDDWSY